LDGELKKFVERGVLQEQRGVYRCRVLLFERFLEEQSAELVSIELTDQDERRLLEKQEIEAYVHASEVMELIARWGAYHSLNVSEDRVRAWLAQFGSNQDQRLMFTLLKALRFYSERVVREKLKDAMDFVRRNTVEKKKEGERFRRDILVSYLGGVAKSGPQYARMFCQENRILRDNAISWQEMGARVRRASSEIQAVVFVEDILGTGGTAIDAMKDIAKEVVQDLKASRAKLFLVAVCGFSDALSRVEDAARELELPLEVYCSESLNEADKAFSESSKAFETAADRERALLLARKVGERLEKRWPLGHGDCQALVVFFSNCPNNTLPIIYKVAADWQPLFARLTV
jgi:hypothetical protein